MITLRFGKEYRMDTETLPNGKSRQKMIYTGPLFDFCDSETEHKEKRILHLCVGIVTFLLLIIGYSFYSNLSRVWFVSIPYACNLLVGYLYLESVGFFWKYTDSLNREHKEKGGDRLKSLSMIYAGFDLFSLVASFVAMFTYLDEISVRDYVFLALTLIQLMLMIFSFTKARKIEYLERKNPVADEWKDK